MLQETSTSYKTQKYFGYCLKKNILFSIICAVCFILTSSLQFSQINVGIYAKTSLFSNIYGYGLIGYFDTCIIWGIALVSAILNFRFLFSQKLSDIYYLVPIRKNIMFWCNYFSGLLAIIIPFILFRSPILNIILKDGNADPAVQEAYLGNLNSLWMNFAVQTLSLLLAYAVAVFFVVNFGKILDLCIYYFSLRFLLPTAMRVVYYILNTGMAGIESENSHWMYGLNNVLINGETADKMLGFVLYLLAIAAFSVGAFFLFRIRKNERYETAFAFNYFKPVMMVVASLVLGFCGISILLLSEKYNAQSLAVFTPVFFIGAAVAFVGTLMLSKRSVNILDKHLYYFAVPSMLFVVLLAYVGTAGFGRAAYIPKISQIESVSITKFEDSDPYWEEDYLNQIKDFTGKNIVFDAEVHKGTELIFTRDEAIKTVREYHKSLLGELDKYHYDVTKITNNEEFAQDTYAPTITYKLKNGKTVTRRYTCLSKLWRKDEFYKMISLEESGDRNKAVFKDYLSKLDIGNVNCEYYPSFPLSEFVCEKKNLSLKKEDFIELLTTIYAEEELFYSEVYNTAKDYMEIKISSSEFNSSTGDLIKNNSLVIKDNYPKTIELLNKLGLKPSQNNYEGLDYNNIKAELITIDQAVANNVCKVDQAYGNVIEGNSKEIVAETDFGYIQSYTSVEDASLVEKLVKSAVSCYQNGDCRAVKFIKDGQYVSKVYFISNEVLNELGIMLNY